MCISFPPYFDHDAFKHHPMHVLDAPVCAHVHVWTSMYAHVRVCAHTCICRLRACVRIMSINQYRIIIKLCKHTQADIEAAM